VKDLDLDCAFEKMPESFHACMESALLKCKEDVPMKRFTLRTALIAALILALLAGTAFAIATHYSVKDYYRNSSEAFQKNITLIDKNYESEYFSMYVTDAVFDGKSISIAMDIQPKEGTSPVYLYPRLTATCGGRELEVDIEGCRGDFFSGFWIPEKGDYLKGQYSVDACIYEDDADQDVQWALTFMVLKPNWELANDQTVLHGGESDSPHDEFMQRFKDAYAQHKILLYDGYSLVEYASILPAPEGMTLESYQSQRLGPQLAKSEAFTLIKTIECTWKAPVPASYTVINSGDKLELGDYTIVLGKITKSFMRVTWAFDAYMKNGAGDEARISFEPRVKGREALGSYFDGPADDNDPAHYTYGGDFTYSGDMPDSITFVPYTMEYREPTKEEAAVMVTPEPVDGKSVMPFKVYNEAGAFEVKLK
jgi:hypothetical protein